MTIEIQKSENTMTGLISGRLDNASVPQFTEGMQPLKENASKHIILDLTGLQFFSLQGMRMIHSLQDAIHNKGGQLSIRNAAATVDQLFTVTGFASLFNFE